jgi:hypothetical protein
VAVSHAAGDVPRPWHYYRGPQGADPVRSFLAGLQRGDALVVRARMAQISRRLDIGSPVAAGIFELRVRRAGRSHAVLFGIEGRGGRGGRALVALEAYSPEGRRTPRSRVDVAHDRLARWRARGEIGREASGRPAAAARHRELGLGR